MANLAASALFVALVFSIPVLAAAGILLLLVGCSAFAAPAVQEMSTPRQRIGIPGLLAYERMTDARPHAQRIAAGIPSS